IGTVHNYSRGYEAFDKRKKIKEFNSIDEYVENLDEKSSSMRILNHAILNVDSLEGVLGEEYEVEINAYDNLDGERFYFNPYFIDHMDENPFKLMERTYPVDMGAPLDTRVIITMKFPDHYEIVSVPEDKGI